MSQISIRAATPADAGLICAFIRELADYERAAGELQISPERIRDTLFGPDARAHALIAECGETATGYAVYFYNYSTWLGQHGIYLEDLYVHPDYRRRGIGRALLKHLAGIALDQDCGRFEWAVLDWNRPAIDFYRSIGAEPQDEWTVYRLSGDALKRFAG